MNGFRGLPLSTGIIATIVAAAIFNPAAEATTTVTVQGDTVVIHVPIDVHGLGHITVQDVTTGKVTPAATYIEEGVGRIWNDALQGFRYDCWKFRLDLKLFSLPDGGKSTKGHHEIFIDSRAKRSEWNATGPDDQVPDRDFPFAYSRDMRGVFNTADPQVLSHEIGHALGLGDDYFGNTGGNKPEARGIGERAGGVQFVDKDGNFMGNASFMTNGVGGPEAVHLWRVVAMMKDAGVLPPCRWVGTIKVQAVGNIYDEEGELPFAFAEAKDGTVSGSAHFHRTANRLKAWAVNDCTYTRKYSSDEADVPISGRHEGDHFTLTFDPRNAMGEQTITGTCRGKSGSGTGPAILLGPLVQFAVLPVVVQAKDGVITHFHYVANDILSDATVELHDTQQKNRSGAR